MKDDFENVDYWKAIILYGLNNATYKIALGKTLLDLAHLNESTIKWSVLSEKFLEKYIDRLKNNNLPQQANPARKTVMERITHEFLQNRISKTQAVERVANEAFNDVIPRFQTIGTDKTLVGNKFYEFDFGNNLKIHDPLFEIVEHDVNALEDELNARWSLLEGAFIIKQENWVLSNDVREIYLSKGYDRTNLTNNIPFLQGYQGNTCFYCGESIEPNDIHVDHVLPRQVLNNDEVWNLVLAHSYCNTSKSDSLVDRYYIQKLITRNENIMGSNHPWKYKIEKALGNTRLKRGSTIQRHYENVKKVIGLNYWGGVQGYIPELDPFYKKLITRLNNG